MSNSSRLTLVLLLALTFMTVGVYRKCSKSNPAAVRVGVEAENVVAPAARATPAATRQITLSPTPAPEPLLALKKTAEQVVISFAEDRKSVYIFDENDSVQRKALEDIGRQIEVYRQSQSYLSALSEVGRVNDSILEHVCQSRGIRPGLLFSTLLVDLAARAGGGQKVNAAAAAVEVLDNLKWHRYRVGTQAPDSCLLVLAQFKSGQNRSKANQFTMQRQRGMGAPFDDRNVWHLHQQRELDRESYEFVINAIAAGIVARQPGNFSVEAAPLKFENSKCS